ncbi:hypothetical protein EYF80_067273 [Liparis tanakae]|uniref:Uncharacterized protein n=1 Tax=Liparis tanakae TaxID=230148 RepID=A0A4Z2E1I5_9TELE|nr:hypothetical protein EYF80_067273 [Liparis tanakae]
MRRRSVPFGFAQVHLMGAQSSPPAAAGGRASGRTTAPSGGSGAELRGGNQTTWSLLRVKLLPFGARLRGEARTSRGPVERGGRSGFMEREMDPNKFGGIKYTW